MRRRGAGIISLTSIAPARVIDAGHEVLHEPTSSP
jgi:hypothetical protein